MDIIMPHGAAWCALVCVWDASQVLDLIAKGQSKVHEQLDAMPFVVDTFGLRTKHDALTQQLAQLNAAEAAFSHKRVVVADEVPNDGDEFGSGLPLPVAPTAPAEPLEVVDL
jgi:hypothetical protein